MWKKISSRSAVDAIGTSIFTVIALCGSSQTILGCSDLKTTLSGYSYDRIGEIVQRP